MELNEQRLLTDKGDDKESSRDSHHRKEPYSLARGREKHAIINGDPLSIQNDMPKEVELLQKVKLGSRLDCSRERRLKVQIGLHEERVIRESYVAKRIGKESWFMFQPGSMLKFKRYLDLSGIVGYDCPWGQWAEAY
jgi:hypothetical protein